MLPTMKEMNRLRVLQGYRNGKIVVQQAIRMLKRSLRSVYHMVAKAASLYRAAQKSAFLILWISAAVFSGCLSGVTGFHSRQSPRISP